jgi:hypothetical protein
VGAGSGVLRNLLRCFHPRNRRSDAWLVYNPRERRLRESAIIATEESEPLGPMYPEVELLARPAATLIARTELAAWRMLPAQKSEAQRHAGDNRQVSVSGFSQAVAVQCTLIEQIEDELDHMTAGPSSRYLPVVDRPQRHAGHRRKALGSKLVERGERFTFPEDPLRWAME